MDLKDVMDLEKLQKLLDDFEEISGLKAVVVSNSGDYLTKNNGVEPGNSNFSMDIKVKDEKAATFYAETSSDSRIVKAAEVLGQQLNYFANIEYTNGHVGSKFDSIKKDIQKSGHLVQTINEKTGHLKGIAKKQTILSLNATIEAARSGEAGVGFAVVAKSMQDLSNQSAGIYNDIEMSVEEITNLINTIIDAFE